MPRALHFTKLLGLSLALLYAGYGDLRYTHAGTRETMADAMVRMMEVMGLFDPSAMSPMPMSGPFGGFNWGPAAGMPGSHPWSMPFQDPSGLMGKGGEMMRQYAQGVPTPGATDFGKQMFPWMGSPLDGVWEGRNGELLIVQGERFRIYPGYAGYVDGYVKLSGDRLAMYNPSDQNIRPFEYAESEGRLVLRDDDGQLYLYRRLWLDEAASGGAAPTATER